MSWRRPEAPPFRRVVVTGLGLITPLGVGVEQCWERLLTGTSAIVALLPEHLPAAHRHAWSLLPSRVAGVVDSAAFYERSKRPQDARRSARFIDFARAAADEAVAMARYSPATQAQKDASGVCIGSAMSSVAEVAAAGQAVLSGKPRSVSPFFVPKVLSNMAAGMVSIDHGYRGPSTSPATACATGLHAVGEAFRTVQRGDADVMLCGSAEACIDAISINGFCRMNALSMRFNDAPHRASRPFDVGRDGFVIAEGAGVLLLEELEHALARGATPLAEVRGFGTSSDAQHIVQPPVDGYGAALAMRRALRGSGLAADDVDYVNAHATSTPLGDETELAAISQVFGDRARGQAGFAVSSTKGATGHLLGAAGSVEAAFTVLAVARGVCPPSTNLETPFSGHPGCLIRGSDVVSLPPRTAALCNSFGFGGTNASILFASVD